MDHYDAPWKKLICRHLAEFLAFGFPSIHEAIDWSAEYCFPDHELPPLAPDSVDATLQPDLVATATTLAGQPVCLHIEIQGHRERGFARRVYAYQTRLRDRLGLPVASLLVLADRSPGWRPLEFSDNSLGLRLTSQFAAIKLLDFRDRPGQLAASPNPFAFMTAAHLAAMQTRHSPQWRGERKRELVLQMFQHDWNQQLMADLFNVLDWMMPLPDDMQRALVAQVRSLQRRFNMPFENCLVKYAKLEARAEGLAEGRAEGRVEGRRLGAQHLVQAVLALRFGQLGPPVLAVLDRATEVQLEALGLATMQAATLEEALTAAGLTPGPSAA
jgi:hypothetical protein